MRLPCERVVNEALPSVRSLIANELQDRGYNQTEIADLLNITQPAVSQYLNATRGKHIQRLEQDEEAWNQLQDLITAMTTQEDSDRLSQRLHDVCLTMIDEDCNC